MKDIKLLIRDLDIILKDLFSNDADYSHFSIILDKSNYYPLFEGDTYLSTSIGIKLHFDYGDGHTSTTYLNIDSTKDLRQAIKEKMIEGIQYEINENQKQLLYWANK